MTIQTVYPFSLPKGYMDKDGKLHRDGEMRLATARDEMEVMRDPKVKEDESYIASRVMAKVVTALGTLPKITPEIIEGLFVSDLEFLQDMYDTINRA